MKQTKPNILFMLSDDHAVQAISALNDHLPEEKRLNATPNLDRIAQNGAVFENSFCCNSICTPSRAAILTGKHSYQNGVLTLRDSLAEDQTTFAGLLREQGYQTAIAGKWHLNCEPKDFDFWQVLPGQGHYYNPEYLTPEGKIQVQGYSEDITTDAILNWLDNRDTDQPFLACCQFKAPHRPWMPAPRHVDLYEGHTFPEPETLRDDYANRCELLKENKMEIARHMRFNSDLKVHDAGPNSHRLHHIKPENWEYEFDRMTPEQRKTWDDAYAARNEYVKNTEMTDDEFISWSYQAYVTDYLRCIAAIDENVGRLLDYLDANGLAENTIVVYCSDQGFYLGEHRWFDKRWMFEESLRMPLLMSWPGKIAPGSRFNQLVQNIDYAPTFLEAAGIDTPADMHGTSLLRVAESDEEIHEDIYYHYYENRGHGVPRHDGVRTQRYKLIHFYGIGEFNLFDLETDPLELRSFHADPAYADILADMKARYARARQIYAIPAEYGAA